MTSEAPRFLQVGDRVHQASDPMREAVVTVAETNDTHPFVRWEGADREVVGNRNQLVLISPPPITAPERPSNKVIPPEMREALREISAIGQEADPVNNPPHYNQGAVECIDAIESALGPEGFRAYCKGNALKYIWREQHKGGTESLRKAIWYLDRLVSGR
jgi:hypothetical protein